MIEEYMKMLQNGFEQSERGRIEGEEQGLRPEGDLSR